MKFGQCLGRWQSRGYLTRLQPATDPVFAAAKPGKTKIPLPNIPPMLIAIAVVNESVRSSFFNSIQIFLKIDFFYIKIRYKTISYWFWEYQFLLVICELWIYILLTLEILS